MNTKQAWKQSIQQAKNNIYLIEAKAEINGTDPEQSKLYRISCELVWKGSYPNERKVKHD